MNKTYSLIASACGAILLASCGGNYLEVDTETLQTEIYEPTAIKYEGLQSSTVLYLDHSTCVIDARQNSAVFNALRPQLGQYSDELVLIKGDSFDRTQLNRSDNKVFEILQTIREDIPYSDILKALEEIVSSNQQSILVTDCEYLKVGSDKKILCHDEDPYLSAPFIQWLKKGHVIYIISEPYQEKVKSKTYNKQRFYFIFTDDRMDAPISHNMLNEIKKELANGSCALFKLTNSDISVGRDGEMVEKDLTFTIEKKSGFEYIAIDDPWDIIREYVMKLDKYGEPIPDEKAVPLIKNLVFSDMNNYDINDVEILATNITAQYVALSEAGQASEPEDTEMEEKLSLPDPIKIPDGFRLDEDALQNHRLDVMLTDKVFNYLTDSYGGNLIRLDFAIKQASIKQYDASQFVWQSIYNNTDAICVAKSIENALHDLSVVPVNNDRRIIHTVFMKTEAYK